MPCQVHTSSQHIIINCTLNYSVQLTMREWMEWERWRERERRREKECGWTDVRAALCSNLYFKTKGRYSDGAIIQLMILFGLILYPFPSLCLYLCLETSCTSFDILLRLLVVNISIFSRSGCIVCGQETCSNSTCPSVLF